MESLCVSLGRLFTDIFVQVLYLQTQGDGAAIGQNIFWASASLAGIILTVTGLNNVKFRFVVALGILGKIFAFLILLTAFSLGKMASKFYLLEP